MQLRRLLILALILFGFGVGMWAVPVQTAQGQAAPAPTPRTPTSELSCPDFNRSDTGGRTVWQQVRCTRGVITVWRVVLSFVDIIVVIGLIVVAFANILNIRLDTYGIKQALPGLIIGIVLANLSFFVMHFFIEVATLGTQAIGNLVSGYTDNDINNSYSISYLATKSWNTLATSLFTFPPELAGSNGLGFVAYNVGAIGAVGATAANIAFGVVGLGNLVLAGSGLVILFWLIVLLIPILLFLILIFLLYIRTYVLMLLFMLSPLAFFALGFPPLKMLWSRWWGFFWKWLLMSPVAFGVIALMIIFLRASAGEGENGARSLFDYLFFNGLAIGMLFLANRIPFMWGSLMGTNVMNQWGKLGKKGSEYGFKGAKAGADRALMWRNNKDFDKRFAKLSNTANSYSDLKKFAQDNKLQGLRDPSKYASEEAYRAAIERSLQAAQTKGNKTARSRNLLRAPEAAYQGWKKFLSLEEEAEKKQIEKSQFYGGNYDISFRNPITGKVVKKTPYRGTTTVRNKKEYDEWNEIAKYTEDPNDLGQQFGNLTARVVQDKGKSVQDALNAILGYEKSPEADRIASPFVDRLFQKLKGFSASDVYAGMEFGIQRNKSLNTREFTSMRQEWNDRKNQNNPQVQKLRENLYNLGFITKPDELITARSHNKLDMFQKLTGLDLSDTTLTRDQVINASLSAEWQSASGSPSGGTLPGGGTPKPTGKPPVPSEVVVKNIEDAGKGNLNREQEADIHERPSLHMNFASELYQAAQQELEDQLKSFEGGGKLEKGTTKRIVDSIFRSVQSGLTHLDPSHFTGLTPEEVKSLVPHIQKYSRSARGLNKIIDTVMANDDIGVYAHNAKARLKLDTSTITSDIQNAKQAATKLAQDTAKNLDSKELTEIHLAFAKIKPTIDKVDTSVNAGMEREQIRAIVDKQYDTVKGELSILTDKNVQQALSSYKPGDAAAEQQMQRATELAAKTQQVTKQALIDAARESQLKLKGGADPIQLAQDVEIIQKITPHVRTVIDTQGMKDQFDTMDPATQQQKLTEVASKVVQTVIEEPLKQGNSNIMENALENRTKLHDEMIKHLEEGFGKVG